MVTREISPQTAAPAGEDHQADAMAVRRIRGGDAEAYAQLVQRHGPLLHRVLMRFLRNEEDVRDLLQEVFIKAYQALDRYDPTRPFFPWLRRIGVNAAINELERRKRRGEVDDPEPAFEGLVAKETSDRRATEHELQASIELELQTLPTEWAAVFRLRVYEEMSYAEIADCLDIPMGSVMSRLARARARLAERLRSRYGPQGELAHD